MNKQEEVEPLFPKLGADVKFLIYKTLWLQKDYDAVRSLCETDSEYAKSYPNPQRGGVIGELLQLTNPLLRKETFPFLSYSVFIQPDNPNWDWDKLSCDPVITNELVDSIQYYPWNWSLLRKNESYTGKGPWKWAHLACNPNITWGIIEANSDKEELFHWNLWEP